MKLLELLNGVDYKVLQGSDEKEINKIQYDSRKITENPVKSGIDTLLLSTASPV